MDIFRSYFAYEHLTGDSKPKNPQDKEWYALDSTIKRWFYSIVDMNLLKILDLETATAHDFWKTIEDTF